MRQCLIAEYFMALPIEGLERIQYVYTCVYQEPTRNLKLQKVHIRAS